MLKKGVIIKEKKSQKNKMKRQKKYSKHAQWFPSCRNKFLAKIEVLNRAITLDEKNTYQRLYYFARGEWLKCPEMEKLYFSCSDMINIFKSNNLSKTYIEPYLRFNEKILLRNFVYEKKVFEKNIFKINSRKPRKKKFYSREIEDQIWEILLKSSL